MKNLLLAITIVLLASTAQASVFWVSKTGGTTGICKTAQSANESTDPGVYLRNIKDGLACLGAAAGGGANQTVLVKAGTYPTNGSTESLNQETNGDFFPKGSSLSAPFILKCQTQRSCIS